MTPRSAAGGLEPAATVALTHAYYLPGRQHPIVVIGQAPAYPGRQGSDSALMYLLRSPERRHLIRSPDSLVFDVPTATTERTVRVEEAAATASFSTWPDPRITQVRFEWRQGHRVEIAAWDYPLDADFFRSLSPIGH